MKNFVYILLISLSFISCEKYIDFDAEVKQPKLVINGIINPDSTFDIHISRSLSVIDNAELSIVEDATVNILDENGGVYETLSYYYDGHYLGVQKPMNNQRYSIEVATPGFEDVSSSTAIPNLVSLSDVDTLGVEDVDGFKELELTITFQDIANEENFYMLEVFAADLVSGQVYLNPMSMRSDDVTLGLDENGYDTQVFFSDELFDGETKTLVVYVEDTRDYDDYIEIRMTSITQELERYARTQNAYENNYGNPFAQPVQVYSNVEGGFGIFAGYQVSRKKITF
ncbi:DUF4249 domain-containing protein [Parvicella tangerina]|uniref:DUF4249 domain-containing protein n=1 Tax=Parvicella tangerina TaxID=2829795 RepID=A0A916JK22_9FLAO|nr:DUF4249 domain-containing protein [Parvicella tangerina]CAG5077753.1 hypothetical protein CRYO30217_00474 [Parvicella tangerina]